MNLIISKKLVCLVVLIASVALSIVTVSAADGDPDAKQEVRDIAVKAKLKERKNISLLYVKGLVCPSCAIGIRVKVGKLPFVDVSRYKRGVDMDIKSQLLTIALLPDVKTDKRSINKAVSNAGYDAVEWYSMEGGKIKAHPFASAKKK